MEPRPRTRSPRPLAFPSVFSDNSLSARMKIMLNGDPFEISGPTTITGLLDQLQIDPRRVAVEHNLVILKRDAFEHALVNEGDTIEIVNFVGGGIVGRHVDHR